MLAYENGAEGILISNHGGRQLDTTRPSIDVLLEIRKHAPHLLRPEFRGPTGVSKSLLANPQNLTATEQYGKPGRKFEIFVDGGIERGTDVVKALCLGANAVGVGRGFLFAQSVAGVEGVEHAVGSEYLHPEHRCQLMHSFTAGDPIDDEAAGGQQDWRSATEHVGSQGVVMYRCTDHSASFNLKHPLLAPFLPQIIVVLTSDLSSLTLTV